MRGPFGSGKTEFAETITDNVISSWDYFARYGDNKWNEKLKPYADEYCRNSVKDLMINKAETIAVVSSFSKESDMDYFYALAKELEYTVLYGDD